MPNATTARPVVLLVEDEPVVLEVVAIELKEAGFEVISARSGEVAVAAIESGAHLDLVFTDIRLSGQIDGWEVAARARARQRDVPVIYASGLFEQEEPRRVAGSMLVSKPYGAGNLIAAATALGLSLA